MNKPIYVNVDICNINVYANDYEVVHLYESNYDTVSYYDKERTSGYGSSPVQIPIILTSRQTMVLMKLKKAAEVLYGETK